MTPHDQPRLAKLTTDFGSTERIHHPAERRMLTVLHLDPAIEPTAAVGTVTVLGDQTLQAELAGVPE
jgi:hypothetical protein